MKKKLFNYVFLITLLAGGTPVAIASTAGFFDHGDYLTDSHSGLDWKDVTLTVNRSYNDVSSQLGAGGEFDGWRYATSTEFVSLIKNYTGLISIPVNTTIQLPEGTALELVTFLGSTWDSPYQEQYGQSYEEYTGYGLQDDRTYGMVIDDGYTGESTQHAVPFIHYLERSQSSLDLEYVYAAGLSMTDTQTDNTMGSFLVRDTVSAVPVPAAVWLFGSAIAGLGFSSRRKLSAQ